MHISLFKFLSSRKFKLFIFHKLLPVYNSVLKIILPKSFLLKNYGLLAIGEKMRIYKNPRWVTLDLIGNPDIKLNLEDISKGLPFQSNSLMSIYSSHNLEHISITSSISFFREAKRILRIGGELLLDVPCAETIYKLIGTSINDPDNLKLKRFLKEYEIYDELLKLTYETCPSNKNVPIEWINHPINQLSQIIACYMNRIDSVHLPVINDPEKVIAAYKDLSMDDFFEYLFNKLPKKMRYSGGHCEAWYPQKVKKFLDKEGFVTNFRFPGESETLKRSMIPDRLSPIRDAYSFKISAIKIS